MRFRTPPSGRHPGKATRWVRNADKHDLRLTRSYYDSLPEETRRHITCRVVDTLAPIVQAHAIEGLRMGMA